MYDRHVPGQASDRYASAYGRGAGAYARVLEPTLSPVARRILDLADVRSGERLLDVATGTGVVAREASKRGAAVSGIDIAAEMIDTARERSSRSIEFVCGDAGALPFADHAFDIVTCGFGLSHMPDPSAVLDEVRRVLRAGGRFVESSWGSEGENEAFTAILGALRAASGGDLHAFAGILDEDTWADPERGAALIASAGFDVDVVIDRLTGRYDSPSTALDWTLAWPDYAETVALLSEGKRASFRTTAAAEIAESELSWGFAINYYVATKTPEPPPR